MEESPLRGDLVKKLPSNETSVSELRGSLVNRAKLEPRALIVGASIVQRDSEIKGDPSDYIVEAINERPGKDSLVILRSPKGESISRAKADLEGSLSEEGGAWSWKTPPAKPKS